MTPGTPRRRSGDGSLRRYLSDHEQLLLSTRQHPFALARAATDALGLLIPLGLAGWGIAGIEALRGAPADWLLRAMLVTMLILIVRLALQVLEWEFERVVVTDEKVIHLAGVFSRRIASTPLAKVSEFTVHQPLLGRLFDYGSLVVDVPGGREQALHGLAHIPDPSGMYRLVSDQARERSRGRSSAPARPASNHDPRPADPVRQPASDPWQPVRRSDDQMDHTIEIPTTRPPH